jgi:hypothetical protein
LKIFGNEILTIQSILNKEDFIEPTASKKRTYDKISPSGKAFKEETH